MREDFTFLSKDGRTPIHAVRWTPEEGKIKAILQIMHGMLDHIERYEAFALYLIQHGFMVVGHDHIGHGSSVLSEEDWGYFAPENAGDILIEDIHQLREITRKEYPGIPYFMLGHSMGSFLLRKYIVFHGDISGAIIMGSGCSNPRSSKLGILIAEAFAMVFGWRHRSRIMNFLAFRKNLRYDTSGKNPERNWLSRDPEIVKRYYSDPRCTYLFTLNGFKTQFETVLFVCTPENVDRVPEGLPILIVSGEDDPVGEGGKGVERLGSMFWKAGVRDLKVKIYKGYRHDILNEADRDCIFRDLRLWMEKRISPFLRT